MKRTPKTKVTRLHELKEVDALRVSIVDHGANQVPFNVLKADVFSNGESSLLISLSFPKSAFSEPEVDAWLKENGFSDYQILDADDRFSVDNGNREAFAGTYQVTDDAGIIYTIGTEMSKQLTDKQDVMDISDESAEIAKVANTKAEAAQKAENIPAEQPSKEVSEINFKAEISPSRKQINIRKDGKFISADELKGLGKEEINKVDFWALYESDHKTTSGVMNAAVDGRPLGWNEIFQAYVTALNNAVMDKDTGAIQTSSEQFVSLLSIAFEYDMAVGSYVNGRVDKSANTSAIAEVAEATQTIDPEKVMAELAALKEQVAQMQAAKAEAEKAADAAQNSVEEEKLSVEDKGESAARKSATVENPSRAAARPTIDRFVKNALGL